MDVGMHIEEIKEFHILILLYLGDRISDNLFVY